jgi:peptidoglycan/LPS O-acetylase OafA/YrhL
VSATTDRSSAIPRDAEPQALLHGWMQRTSARISPTDYRPDIDGLRAIAILSVVLFHAFPTFTRGGFVGVDVFFVISGYLISGIVFKGLRQGGFSFRSFYVHRARRIFPALVLVLAATYVFGWFWLLPDEFGRLGQHIAAGTGFAQNLLLWRESGYFDTASELKPLLHLWSLAIEEQFYLVYPLAIWLLWRTDVNVLVALVMVGLVSFGVNLRSLAHDSVGGFFLPHARFWELLVGGIGAYAAAAGHQWRSAEEKAVPGIWRAFIQHIGGLKNLVAWMGLLLILLSVFGLHRDARFPGWWALLPVTGAIALIMAGPAAWVNQSILSSRWLVFVGLISYPLYLWHWPLLSLAHLVSGQVPVVEVRVMLVLLAVLLAWLTYQLIERPIRFGARQQAWALTLTGFLLVLGGLGGVTFWKAGLPSRDVAIRVEPYTQSVVRTSRETECFEIPHAYERADGWNCVLGSTAVAPSVMAFGDSHALSLIPVLDQYGLDQKVGIVFAGTSGCPPLLGVQSLRGAANMALHNCQKLNERIFEFVRTKGIRRVLLIGRWTYYTGGVIRPGERNPISMDVTREDSVDFARQSFVYGMEKTVRDYRGIGVEVLLVNDTPQQEMGPIRALKMSGLYASRVNDKAVTWQRHHEDQVWIRALIAEMQLLGAMVVDFDDVLCRRGEICPLAMEGKSLYYDSDHLSVYGAMTLYPVIKAALLANGKNVVRPVGESSR